MFLFYFIKDLLICIQDVQEIMKDMHNLFLC